MDLAKTFGTDKALESEGVWFDVGDGARLKIARSNNPQYRTELSRLLKPHRAAARAGNLDPDVFQGIVVEAMSIAILKDWEGIALDGEPVAYSRAAAAKAMGDFPDFRTLVEGLADQRDAYLAGEVEAGKKTSKK